MDFIEVGLHDEDKIKQLSAIASEIVKEHYDPILGAEQNDYMIEKFQSVAGIKHQLESGYKYYIVKQSGAGLGFLAFYPRDNAMYLSKFYLYKQERGKGYSKQMLNFVIEAAREQGLTAIELNVNKYNDAILVYEKLGFKMIRKEKNDIGNNYYMDDFVYRLMI